MESYQPVHCSWATIMDGEEAKKKEKTTSRRDNISWIPNDHTTTAAATTTATTTAQHKTGKPKQNKQHDYDMQEEKRGAYGNGLTSIGHLFQGWPAFCETPAMLMLCCLVGATDEEENRKKEKNSKPTQHVRESNPLSTVVRRRDTTALTTNSPTGNMSRCR